MGLIFSRKKKKSTKDILEDLEKDIRKIEEFRQHTEQKQKRTVGKLLLYGIPLYVLVAVAVFFYELPTFLGKLLAVAPLLILPILFFFIRRTVTWYFRRQLSHNEEKLTELYAKKKKILEDVMETETYKVAKEILEKFAPDQLRNRNSSNGNQDNPFLQNYSRTQGTPQQTSELRKRVISGTGAASGHSPPQQGPRPQISQRTSPYGAGVGRGVPPAPMHTPFPSNAQRAFGRGVMVPIPPPPGPPMPRPIPPYERSFMDRMMEYLVGDGPSNRYALICRQCESHNGMALQEEFEYLAFRCCYCYYWNPARKQRPHAPRLPTLPPPPPGGAGGRKDVGGDESVSEEDGSEETSSEAPSGDPRDPPDGDARDSEEDACSDSGDAASKEERSHRESLLGAEDVSEANGQELTGSEATPASSSSASPSTEEDGGGAHLAQMEKAASLDSGASSGSPAGEDQVMEELVSTILTKQD